MTTETLSDRVRRVSRHVELENAHDLDAVMDTFGAFPSFDDEPWGEHHRGRDGVRGFYEQIMRAVPDLHIEPQRSHASSEVVVLECTITGTHGDEWHGLPATGRRVSVPLCGIYTFDDEGKLAGERIYYDRASVLEQLGVLHAPESIVGRITTALMHPLTMARVATRSIRERRP